MMPLILRFFTSRLGLAALVLAGAWGWHVYDKRQALAHARDGYVTEFELAATEAELAATKERLSRVATANRRLLENIEIAEKEAELFAAELEAYERETEINANCRLDDNVFDRLRYK